MGNKRLNIVDEAGNIIGEETRERIHREGLLHKIVHVWFYTADKKLIFQRRGKNAETHPNQLDATAGGHVEMGQSDIEAAIAETKEETGVLLEQSELVPLGVKKLGPAKDEVTGTLSSHLVTVFAYLFGGEIEKLKAESNEDGGIRFEAIPISKILSLTKEEKKDFIASLLKPDYLEIFRKIKDL